MGEGEEGGGEGDVGESEDCEGGDGEGAESKSGNARGKGVWIRVLERELRTIGGRGWLWVGRGRVMCV